MKAINLRLEDRLHRKLARAAEQNGRSLQTEIVHRLEESFGHRFTSEEDLKKFVSAIVDSKMGKSNEGTP